MIPDLTISGDGTTNKHLDLELKHGLMHMPTYAGNPDAPAMNTIPPMIVKSGIMVKK